MIAQTTAQVAPETHLQIGSLLFEGLDQIDLTGPFEVLSRIPNATYRVYGKTADPVRDIRGLRLTPDAALADGLTSPSIFTALQEQLGLRLEARKTSFSILVIDHMDRVPTGN